MGGLERGNAWCWTIEDSLRLIRRANVEVRLLDAPIRTISHVHSGKGVVRRRGFEGSLAPQLASGCSMF